MTSAPTPTIDEIKGRLEKATPGEWHTKVVTGLPDEEFVAVMNALEDTEVCILPPSGEADAAYIAACSPKNIGLLLSELSRLEKRVGELEAENQRLREAVKNERERCAGIADLHKQMYLSGAMQKQDEVMKHYVAGFEDCASKIASAIRTPTGTGDGT